MSTSEYESKDPVESPPGDSETTENPGGTEASGVEDTSAVATDTLVAELPEHLHIEEDDTDEQITEKLRRQGVKLGKGNITPRVFWPAMISVLAIALAGMFLPEATDNVLQGIQGWIVEHLGWYYVLAIAFFIGFSLFICFSKYGKIRLGRDDDRPEFSVLTWFCMLFAAGMGIGLVFYGVGEPLTYATIDPKPGWEGDEADLAKLAMAQTFVHWGLHPWAIYAVIGLAVAYTIHRRGRPVSIRWVFEPLLGDKVKGWAGDVIDVLAIFGTIFGVATSLGLGVQQIGSGLTSIGIVDEADNLLLVILIVVITFVATVSVVSGVGRGMKWLSNINLSMAGILLISVLMLGPTLFLFQNLVESLGAYLANFMDMTFDVAAYTGEEGNTWASSWTLFYWGWWISWAPFVGIFIARISRGRTVREFLTGVMLVPSIVGFIWFAVLGGTGIHRQLYGDGDLVPEDPADFAADMSLFDVLGGLPLGTIFSFLAIILVAIFFITSSDSGSLVIDMLASGGHPNPPTWSRILFSALEGALAIGLLLAGGLQALQAASLATALPFSVILLLMCWATLRNLRADQERREEQVLQDRYRKLSRMLKKDFGVHFGPQVDERIDYRLTRSKGAFDRKPGQVKAEKPKREEHPVRSVWRRAQDGWKPKSDGQPGQPGQSGQTDSGTDQNPDGTA
ncbi:BCCT family transporter [Micrococcaceae sp. AOP34-BR2-30]